MTEQLEEVWWPETGAEAFDVGFRIRFRPASHSAEYRVAEVASQDDDDPNDINYGDVGQGWTKSIDEAEALIRGWIKWDGCCDLDIGEGDSYQLHFCGHKNARIVGRAIDAIYDLAAKHIPHWGAELAE